MATHDALTKLFNRSFFTIKLEEEFQRAERYKLPLSLIIMDIDNFKLTNDTYGHQAGDAYLESLADLVKGSVRQVDTVARYGGEELVVILPHTEPDGALALAERLRATVAAHEVSYDGNTIQGTISLGLVSYKEGSAATVDELLKAADNALYDAKHGGRNRVVVSHEGMEPVIIE
jgi:diguanylate cyclase (GGDEF)-like protein